MVVGSDILSQFFQPPKSASKLASTQPQGQDKVARRRGQLVKTYFYRRMPTLKLQTNLAMLDVDLSIKRSLVEAMVERRGNYDNLLSELVRVSLLLKSFTSFIHKLNAFTTKDSTICWLIYTANSIKRICSTSRR